jgi:hypothetical protein
LLFSPASRGQARRSSCQLGPVSTTTPAQGGTATHHRDILWQRSLPAPPPPHINTTVQRLERITGLLGEGWRTGDTGLQVHLAVKLHRIVTTNAG